MGVASLLNTSTLDYLSLIGNGKVFRVPPYQRDYSWSEEQWEYLWADIVEMRSNPQARHYMGAMVVEGSSEREFWVIDGQQRMATLSVLALAVIDKLQRLADQGVSPEQNRERALELRHRYIGEKDPATLLEVSKLLLNDTDNAFYQDYLVQLRTPLNPRGLPRSNRLLWDCYLYFGRELDRIEEFSTAGDAVARLLSEVVARQLLFILIVVDDQLSAYTVFETLNARGLELSATDLLKNYLFSRVRVATDLASLQRRWQSLVATVRQERFPEFLRYHLLCEHPKIRSQRLLRLIRDKVTTPTEVFALVEALERRAELFAALSDPSHGYWIDLPAAKEHINALLLFRVRQATPLLFAAWEQFTQSDFARVLDLVSLVSFRYTVVSGLNPNALEPIYHVAAKQVLDGTARTPAAVFGALKPIYVDDGKFEQDFASLVTETSGQRRRLAKYILAKLETDVAGRRCDPETDPATIEHILPENPAEAWAEHFTVEQQEALVFRVGNLALLSASANRRVGNAPYVAKALEYAQSEYHLTRQVPDLAPEEWTPDRIHARQQRMARRAAHIWRSPFAVAD